MLTNPCPAHIVYKHTFQRVIAQNKKYYTRFPGDVEVVKDIVNFLAAQPGGGVQTPSGTWIRPRTFQLLGLSGEWSCNVVIFMCSNAFQYPEPCRVAISASFLAEISVRSPRKLFIYIIYKHIFWIKVSKKYFI